MAIYRVNLSVFLRLFQTCGSSRDRQNLSTPAEHNVFRSVSRRFSPS